MLGRRLRFLVGQVSAVALRDTKHEFRLSEAIHVHHADLKLGRRHDLEVFVTLFGEIKDQFPLVHRRVKACCLHVLTQMGITDVKRTKSQQRRRLNHRVVRAEQVDLRAKDKRARYCKSPGELGLTLRGRAL